MSAWDTVQAKINGKCFSKCGFTTILPEEEDDTEVDSDLEAFENLSVTCEEYTNFDADLSSNETIEKDLQVQRSNLYHS